MRYRTRLHQSSGRQGGVAWGGRQDVSACITSRWAPSEAKVSGQITSHNGRDHKRQPQSHAPLHTEGGIVHRSIVTFWSPCGGGVMVRTSWVWTLHCFSWQKEVSMYKTGYAIRLTPKCVLLIAPCWTQDNPPPPSATKPLFTLQENRARCGTMKGPPRQFVRGSACLQYGCCPMSSR